MNISCAPWFSCMTICELPTWSYCSEVELSIKREDKQCCFLSKPKLFCFLLGTLFIHHIHLYPTFLRTDIIQQSVRTGAGYVNYPNQLHVPSLCSQNPSQQDSIFGSHYSASVHFFHYLSNNNEHIATLFIRHFDTCFRRMIFHFVHSRTLSWDKKQRYVTFYIAQKSVSKLHFLDLHFPRYPIPYNFFWEF